MRIAVAGAEFDQALVRIEAMQAYLGLHCITVRREGAALDQQLVSALSGAVEARHHQVQVHGERVHVHDFDGFGAHQSRRAVQ